MKGAPVILLQDLRYGLRQLWRSPGFTLTTILTVALGIGANTAIFSIFNALVLRPIPAIDPARIVNVYRTVEGETRYGVFSYPDYVDYRDHNTSLSGLAAFTGARMTLRTTITAAGADSNAGDGTGQTLQALLVSGNYFSVLGVGASSGRTFALDEDQAPDSHPVVVVSLDLWQHQFQGDPNLVGSTIVLNSLDYTVIGIAPKNFAGTEADPADLWVPMMMIGSARPGTGLLKDRDSMSLKLIGRLKPGITREQAQAEMTLLAGQFSSAKQDPNHKLSVTLTPGEFLDPQQLGDVLPLAVLLMAAVGLVLLIACANVANLLLARAAGRQREIGIRMSLGSTRGRLVRQLLTESMILALAGGAGGLILALFMSRLLLASVHPPGAHRFVLDVSLDFHVLGYALLLSVITGFVCGLLPALRSSRPDLAAAAKDECTAFGQRISKSRLRSALVVSQVAISLFLLVGAGLLVRALQKAQTVTPGFEMKNVYVVSEDLSAHAYDAARAREFQRALTERLEALPGVKSVGLARTAPLGSSFAVTPFAARDHDPAPGFHLPTVNFNSVSPAYFDALGISIVRGRNFTSEDLSQQARVAIVSESMARRFWPGENPIGKEFHGGGASPYREVIGVAKNVRNVYLWTSDEPYLYLPLSPADALDMQFFVRTDGNTSTATGAVAESVRAAVQTIDRSLQISVQPLDNNLSLWIWPSQLGALLSGALGSLALLLACAGIYAVMAYAVAQRTREIGIRIALGARSIDVLTLVLRQGMRLVLIGAAIGLGGSIVGLRLLSKFLYGISALDSLAFAGVTVLLMAMALVACCIPARRAIRIDPMTALRYE
jgi:macrolide transport system ATP-binding/permease protein